MLPFFSIVACTSGSPGETGSVLGGGAAAPVLEPAWTAGQALEAARVALDGGLPDPHPLRDRYFELVEVGQDADCPGPDLLNTPNLQGCTSDSGYFYAGLATYQEGTNPGADVSWMFSGDFEIVTPEGWSYLVGGHTGLSQDASGFFQVEVSGSWRWDGDPGWLAEGLSAVFHAEGSTTGSGQELGLEGGLGYADVSLYWSEVRIAGDACDGHPTGSLGIREPAGGWYTLTWGEGCDGCGVVDYAGEPAGEGCLDLREAVAGYVALVSG